MHIYFSGIGGSGLSGLSQLCLDCGFEINGSDSTKSLNTHEVEKRGVQISFNQDGKHLEKIHKNSKIDWLVYTAGLKSDHPEIQKAKELGIKISKRDELVNFVIKEKNLKLIGVSGTHGKTTTTGMIIWLFQNLGLPVSYLIGTNISFGGSAEYKPGSEYFVYEADEFDRNFLHFNPFVGLITSLDFDHPDIYKDRNDYNEAFKQYCEQSQKVVSWSDQIEKTGFEDEAKLISLKKENPDLNKVKLKGEHYRQNAFLAVETIKICLTESGIDFEEEILFEKINQFPGTQRRLEKLKENLYTDYAHHPKEIQATIQAARELNSRVIAVYQPHQNIRQYSIKEDYKDAFLKAEKVYWLETYLTREDPSLEVLKAEELIKNVENKEIVEIASLDENLKNKLQEHVEKGELVLAMGAGSIDEWVRKNLD